MDRITVKHLHALALRLNKETGSPTQAYVKPEGSDKYVAQVGCFHISGAYGGWCLHRMVNESGGVTTPLGHQGHIPARQLYDLMHAYLRGIELGRELERQGK